jgi:hypothetical protein
MTSVYIAGIQVTLLKIAKKHKEHLERKKTIPASTNANYHQQNEL